MSTQQLATSSARPRPVHVGEHLREWRQRRHLSQLDLAGDAEVSARHLSFVETGRAAPSRDMVLRLAERLEVPLRERNVLLVAAGFAPAFPQRALDDPALKSARQAIDLVLKAHEPNPALAVDRHWNLVSANRMVAPLLAGLPSALLEAQPLNVLRLSFHPEGMGPRTVNLGEWCAHLLERLHRQCESTADPELVKLYHELKAYPIPARSAPLGPDNVAIPFRMRLDGDVLSFISTTMIFGTPVDITLSEIAVETFFPADDFTAERLRAMMVKLDAG
jgi:transcriptional regulator with XRE-family HTH domain